MAASTKNKTTVKAKATVDKNISDYSNDPFFIKKREMAEEFIKKNGLPESIGKQKSK